MGLARDRENEIVILCEIFHIKYPAEDYQAGFPPFWRSLSQVSVVISGDVPGKFSTSLLFFQNNRIFSMKTVQSGQIGEDPPE